MRGHTRHRALGWMLWALLLGSGSAGMEKEDHHQRPELELLRDELSLHGNRLDELEHNRTYRGLYRWNCSHEAFFPHACKDGEPLWRPPQKTSSRSARRLLQFMWDEADPYLTGGQLVSLHRPAAEALAAERARFEGSGDAACAEAALLTCMLTLLLILLLRNDLICGLARRGRGS